MTVVVPFYLNPILSFFAFRFAVLSLITSAIGKQDDLANSFKNVGFLVVATLVAMVFQFLIVHLLLFWFVTKSNPIEYIKYMVP